MATESDLLNRLIEAEVKLANPVHADLVTALVKSMTRLDANGRLEIVDRKGNVQIVFRNGSVANMDLPELIEELRRTKASLFDGGAAVKSDPSAVVEQKSQPTTLTERMKRANADPRYMTQLLADFATQRPQATQKGNPWAKDSFNLTQQMTLLNTNPTLAARYKAEAGAS